MRKSLLCTVASIGLIPLIAAAVRADVSPPFADTPENHWAFVAVNDLRERNIITGYPDGHFNGQRTLTRYEFAVALKRALDKLPMVSPVGPAGQAGPRGEQGPAGEAGPAGAPGPTGMSPEDIAKLRALTAEFQTDLTGLGKSAGAIKAQLDGLAASVDTINHRLSKMIDFRGDFFAGVRSDNSRYGFIDYSGAFRPANRSLFTNIETPTDLQLSLRARIGERARFLADLVTSSYLGQRLDQAGIFLGGPAADHGNAGNSVSDVYKLYLEYRYGPDRHRVQPVDRISRNEEDGEETGSDWGHSHYDGRGGPGFAVLPRLKDHRQVIAVPAQGSGRGRTYRGEDDDEGHGGELKIGRFDIHGSPLTNARPVSDFYFHLPEYGRTNYIMDGFAVKQPIGPLNVNVWAGSYTGLRVFQDEWLNRPILGSVRPVRTMTPDKPFGLQSIYTQGASVADQVVGVDLSGHIGRRINVGASVTDYSTELAPGTMWLPGDRPYNNLAVYDLHAKYRARCGFRIEAEVARSVTQLHAFDGDANSHDDDLGAQLRIQYSRQRYAAQLTYEYIDPRFSAPGYWDKIGNWINPTNIQGPSLGVVARVTKHSDMDAAVSYYMGARNRNGRMGSGLGLNECDSILRALFGLTCRPCRSVTLGTHYEGDFWSLSARSSASGRGAQPTEQYLTFSSDFQVAPQTNFFVHYQIGGVRNNGNGFGTNVADTYNFNTFTSGVNVHF